MDSIRLLTDFTNLPARALTRLSAPAGTLCAASTVGSGADGGQQGLSIGVLISNIRIIQYLRKHNVSR